MEATSHRLSPIEIATYFSNAAATYLFILISFRKIVGILPKSLVNKEKLFSSKIKILNKPIMLRILLFLKVNI